MEHDLESVVHIARQAAKRLYPQIVVAVPMAVGISEHHMHHKGTISARPGGWLSVLYDTVESLIRHGVKNVLIFNGHGGNTLPVMGTIDQIRYGIKPKAPGANLQFCSYWDLIPRGFLQKHVTTDVIPGHAKEFETAIGLALFPENVRQEGIFVLHGRHDLFAHILGEQRQPDGGFELLGMSRDDVRFHVLEEKVPGDQVPVGAELQVHSGGV